MPNYQIPAPGQNAVAEYMASAIPYISSSAVSPGFTNVHDFPLLTSWIQVRNIGLSSSISFGFTPSGTTGSNSVSVPPNSSSSIYSYRLVTLYVTSVSGSTYEVIAGLTGIPIRNSVPLSTLTGTIGAI